jgi:hypothetical protein
MFNDNQLAQDLRATAVTVAELLYGIERLPQRDAKQGCATRRTRCARANWPVES